MDRHKLIAIAKEAGFKIEAGKKPGVLIVEGDGGLSESTLAKLMELIAEACADVANEGQYNCCCDSNIRQKMTFVLDPSQYGEDIVDSLRRRVLQAHGGTGDDLKDHFNLTNGDSVMHLAAAEEIERLRQALKIEHQKRVTWKDSAYGLDA